MARLRAILLSAALAGFAHPVAGALPDEVKHALAAREFETAADWLTAHADEPEAAFELGKLYRLGKGVVKDSGRSGELFEYAAMNGIMEAQYLLGKASERENRMEDAVRWMQAAADQGHGRASAWLSKDSRTAKSTNDETRERLVHLLRRGDPPPLDANVRDVRQTDEAGRSLLMLAAERGSLAWLDFLLEHGAVLDGRDDIGATALHAAFAARQFNAARRLLESGAEPNVATTDGTTPLHQAVAAGDVDLVRGLLAAGADPDVLNAAGWSPRTLARRADSQALRSSFGLEPVSSDRLAAVTDAAEVQQLIVEAARRGDGEMLESLLQRAGTLDIAAEQATALIHLSVHIAAKQNDVTALALLLDAGLSPDGRDAQGRTPLHTAVDTDCDVCAAELLAHDADPDQTDLQGRSALIVAVRRGGGGTVNVLLESGADQDQPDARGRTALWWACREDRTELAMTMISRSRSLESDNDGVGPLHAASENDNAELATRLIGLTDIDAQSDAGNTPLLLAAHAGSTSVSRILVAAGAGLELRNATGDTALIAATKAGNLETAELLLEAGANPNTRNNQFESAATLIDAGGEAEWQALLERSGSGLFGVFGSLSN